MSERIRMHIHTLACATFIDMGCGTGEAIIEVASLLPQAYYIGIDIDYNALSKARDRIYRSQPAFKVDLLCANSLSLPLASRSADGILFRALLHHIEPIECAFHEAWRILSKGGHLLIQDGEELPMPMFEEMNLELSRIGLPKELHPGFDIDKLNKRLKKFGFLTETVIREGIATFATPPYTSKVYSTGLFLLSASKK